MTGRKFSVLSEREREREGERERERERERKREREWEKFRIGVTRGCERHKNKHLYAMGGRERKDIKSER